MADINRFNERDPGLGTKYGRRTNRVINKNGTFNVVRVGTAFSTRNVYQALLRMSWPLFLGIVILAMVLLNALFALLYVAVGVEGLTGIEPNGLVHNFMQAFYFSFQTFTTVGYGALAPKGDFIAFLAALEAMFGLICFALATSLLYGRFSRPSARLKYSNNLLVAPGSGDKAQWNLQFRIANMRQSNLMEMEASMILTYVEEVGGDFTRKYQQLKLERDYVLFFPLNWTIVHAIDESSPLYNKSLDELQRMQAEVLIMLKGYDDTFAQTVHSRYSYTFDEFVWGARFLPCYETGEHGDVVLHLDRLDDYEKVPGCPIHVHNRG